MQFCFNFPYSNFQTLSILYIMLGALTIMLKNIMLACIVSARQVSIYVTRKSISLFLIVIISYIVLYKEK